jgi:hypothetical protein
MSKTVYLNKTLITAINKIASAGHSVALEACEGGMSLTSVFITIGVYRAGDVSPVTTLRVRYTYNYSGFEDFMGMDDRFSDLCHWQSKNVEPFLDFIKNNPSITDPVKA